MYKSVAGTTVTLLVSKENRSSLAAHITARNYSRVQIFECSLQSFLDSNRIDQFDRIVVNTMYSGYELLYNAFRVICRTTQLFITIHNINYSLKRNLFYRFYPKYRNEDQKFLHKLIRLSSGIIVLSENLKTYVKAQTTFSKIPILVVPYNFAEKDFIEIRKNCRRNLSVVNIVIPGNIDERRKDYLGVLHYLMSIHHKLDFRITLLGAPVGDYGAKVVRLCDELRNSGVDIVYYAEKVDCEEFDRVMLSSDLILGPIQAKTEFNRVVEYYGVSKETGIHFDIIRYCIPALIPSQVPSPKCIDFAILSYEKYDVIESILLQLNGLRDRSIVNKLILTAVHYLPENLASNPSLYLLTK